MASQSSPDHSLLEPARREHCPAGRGMSPPQHRPGTQQEQGRAVPCWQGTATPNTLMCPVLDEQP